MSAQSICPLNVRADMEAVRRKLQSVQGGMAERLALAEVCFRLAVSPDTEPEAALELMQQAVNFDPYHPKLFYHLGRLLHKNGSLVAAIFEYRRALRLAPTSHRTLVHLAIVLSEAGGEERRIGLAILEALHKGIEARLAELTVELDELLQARLAGKRRLNKQPDGIADGQRSEVPQGQSRWKGIWRLFLLNQLAHPKPAIKLAAQHLEVGKQMIEGQQGVSEYALATLFFVMDGPKACRQIASWLRDSSLAAHVDRPSIRLVLAICELGDANGVPEFIEMASAKIEAGELPPDLVCCLHYAWHGTAPNIDVVAAVALLDGYPEQIRYLPSFRELRLAIFDHHARAAWTAERLDRAEIFWRETIPLDPFRIPVAHNLAIVATRVKSLEKYQPAWERAIELRYLLAASAGDVLVELTDRCQLHGSFMRQSLLRYVKENPGKASDDPTDEELRSWMKDRDALGIWLRHGALLYLNSRLRFRSPFHFLGIAIDCPEEDVEGAKTNLIGYFELCFRNRSWAGTKVFLDIVGTMAESACVKAKSPVALKRDVHYELEANDSSQLADEATTRGLLMFRMVKLAASSSDQALKRTGLETARFLLRMPWKSLEPRWKKKGHLSEDTDLLAVFVSYLNGLLLQADDKNFAGTPPKLEAIEDFIAAVPGDLKLRLMQCRLFLDAGLNRRVYESALVAYSLASKMNDRKEAATLEEQFTICIDNAAFSEMPNELQSPSRDKVPQMVAAGRKVLGNFPRAGGLRLLMAKFLIQTADDDRKRLAEANELLEEGLDLFLTDGQLNEARRLLDKVGSRSRSFDENQQIRSLLASASTRVRQVVPALASERTPAIVRQAREELQSALFEAEQAEAIAGGAGLRTAAEKAREFVDELRKMIQNLDEG